jgi:uncharacterized protein YggE
MERAKPMTRAILCAMLLLASATPGRADEILGRAIIVTGEGAVSAAPDMAELSAGVQTRAPTARAALDQNNVVMTRVRAALKTAGIADKDVQTAQLNVSPVYQRNNTTGERHPDGYQVSNSVLVRVRALPTIGTLLDALVSAGANTLGSVRFLIAHPQPLMDEARRRAVADAEHRAKALADAAGVHLGKVQRIDEGGVQVPRPLMAQADFAMRSSAVPVATGEQEIRVTLSVRFGIQ